MTITKKLAIAFGVSAMAFGHIPVAQAQSGTQFIGQVSAFGGNFCPRDWAKTDGQLLPIAQNTALFSIIGTIYGGDGRTTMGLPDLQGRRPIGSGNGPGIGSYPLGQKAGSTNFTMSVNHLPTHTHAGTMRASTQVGDTANPNNKALAVDASGDKIYHTLGATNNMGANTLVINNAGGNQAVNKVSPYQTVQWCIALYGIYPSRS